MVHQLRLAPPVILRMCFVRAGLVSARLRALARRGHRSEVALGQMVAGTLIFSGRGVVMGRGGGAVLGSSECVRAPNVGVGARRRSAACVFLRRGVLWACEGRVRGGVDFDVRSGVGVDEGEGVCAPLGGSEACDFDWMLLRASREGLMDSYSIHIPRALGHT